MVGLLLALDLLLAAFLAAADDVVGDLEGLELDPLDGPRVDHVLLAQLEQRLERRLGVDLGVVALEEGAPDALEVLPFPVDLEVAGDRVHEALVPFEHLRRAADPTRGEEDSLDGAEGGEGVGEPLPLRQLAGAGHAQRVQRRAGDRDRVRRLRLAEAKRLGRAGRGGVGALGRVVEPLRPHRRLVGEPALHLVGDRECGQQFPAGGVRVLGRREHGREIVARMAGLAGGEVGVVEVEVADERPVVERGTVGGRPAAADQGAERAAAEVVELGADRLDRRRLERAKGAAEGIEDTDLQLFASGAREVVPGAGCDEARQPRRNGHERLPRRRISASTTASLCSASRAP